ncbi:MAG: hypothetical protein R3Y21_03060 [Mycoplasmatota bacterium]
MEKKVSFSDKLASFISKCAGTNEDEIYIEKRLASLDLDLNLKLSELESIEESLREKEELIRQANNVIVTSHSNMNHLIEMARRETMLKYSEQIAMQQTILDNLQLKNSKLTEEIARNEEILEDSRTISTENLFALVNVNDDSDVIFLTLSKRYKSTKDPGYACLFTDHITNTTYDFYQNDDYVIDFNTRKKYRLDYLYDYISGIFGEYIAVGDLKSAMISARTKKKEEKAKQKQI